MTLLNMSITGGILILAITVLRALTLNRLPKKTFLALWGLALARLLLPFSLPSALSIYSFLPPRQAAVPSVLLSAFPDPAAVPTVPPDVELPPSAPPMGKWLWLLGALVCGLVFLVAYVRCRREFQMSLPADHPFLQDWLRRHPTRRRISIRQSAAIAAPLTFGLVHPVILLPQSTDWQEETTLDYVLTHEYVHIRRFDILTKLIVIVALCIHWFNPLVWLLYFLANRDLELSCDESVLRRFGEDQRSTYARILIQMEERKSGPSPLCSHFSQNALEERIIAMMNTKKTTLLTLSLSALLIAGTAAVFTTSAKAENDLLLPGGTGTETSVIDAQWWTPEEYEAWLETEKAELQSLVGTDNGWYDGKGKLHRWTQEDVDQQIADYEQTLADLKAGKRHSKPMDTDGDGFPDLSMAADSPETVLNPDVSVTQEVSAPGQADDESRVTQRIGDAASEDASREAMEAFARQMKPYAQWGITYTPENGGNVYYQGKLLRSFVDENPQGGVLMVSSASGGQKSMHTVYDKNGTITGVEAD